jgi:hypothetical protein
MAHISIGEVTEAEKILSQAFDKLERDSYWGERLSRHVDTINSKTLTDIAKIAILQMDFKNDQRHDWIKRCEAGIAKLVK